MENKHNEEKDKLDKYSLDGKDEKGRNRDVEDLILDICEWSCSSDAKRGIIVMTVDRPEDSDGSELRNGCCVTGNAGELAQAVFEAMEHNPGRRNVHIHAVLGYVASNGRVVSITPDGIKS